MHIYILLCFAMNFLKCFHKLLSISHGQQERLWKALDMAVGETHMGTALDSVTLGLSDATIASFPTSLSFVNSN